MAIPLSEPTQPHVTQWTMLARAHRRPARATAAPRPSMPDAALIAGRSNRYLLGPVRDESGCRRAIQEFALRFLRGDFRRADPARDAFRDYLKTALATWSPTIIAVKGASSPAAARPSRSGRPRSPMSCSRAVGRKN